MLQPLASRSSPPSRNVASLMALLPEYDGFLIDLWGVIHDGSALYPGARAALEAIAKAGKRAVLLSNAPRRAARSARTLDALGIPSSLYHGLLTSGEAAFHYIAEKRYNKRCYFIGADGDADILEGMPVRLALKPDEAEFILTVGQRYDLQPLRELKEELETLCWLGLSMVCANPDTEIVTIDGTRYPCAGEIAQYFQQLGGTVQYIGKPYPLVYGRAREMLGLPDDARLLAIGDNLHTDIAGAAQQGIDSLLIAGGVLRERVFLHERLNEALVAQVVGSAGIVPTYYAASLGGA